MADKKNDKQKLPPGIKRLSDGRLHVLATATDPRTKRKLYAERTLSADATLGEAVDLRAQLRAELLGELTPSRKEAPPTLGAYALRWIKARAARVRLVTAKSYERTLSLYVLPRLGDLPVTEIRRSDLEKYAAWLERESGLAIRTQRSAWSKALDLLRDAWEEYDLRPIGRIKGPQGEPTPAGRALSREELDLLVAEARTRCARHSSAVVTLAYTGLRVLEVCRLRWCDLRLDDLDDAWATVNHSKTRSGTGRLVPLPRLAAELLLVHRAEQPASPWVWCHTGDPSRPAPTQFAAEAVASCARAIGLAHTTPHDLRRTFVTLLDRAGVNRLAVRSLVGHSDDATTNTYSRPSPADLRGALLVLEGGRKSA